MLLFLMLKVPVGCIDTPAMIRYAWTIQSRSQRSDWEIVTSHCTFQPQFGQEFVESV